MKLYEIGKMMAMVAAVCVACTAVAKPIDPARAKTVASRYLQQTELVADRVGELYVVHPAESVGFVLVAADDCVRPVLGYSTSARYSSTDMPEHVSEWLDGYSREIASLRQAGSTPSAAVAAMWDEPRPVATAGEAVVDPLIKTTWDQAPYYNNQCPYDGTEQRYTYTGCVATATAQIMKYWNHPQYGAGSHTYSCGSYGSLTADFGATNYRWDDMPDALTAWTDSSEVAAVAELMYHVGVGVEMNFGTSASGAQIISFGYNNMHSSEYALRNYFRYSPMMRGLQKASFTDAEWKSLIYDEVMHGRPVLYAGFDYESGHAFVLDGYDGEGMFHVNWGWGGYNDGYYTIDSLSPGAGGIGGNATYTFNQGNQALVGIEPCAQNEPGYAQIAVVADDEQHGSVVGGGIYNADIDEVTIMAVAAEGYRFGGWLHSGSTENPITFLAVGDLRDTAIFLPIVGDTLGYCLDRLFSSWHDDYSNRTEWGIRLPAQLRQERRQIEAVQFFLYQQDYYVIRIYVGDSISDETMVCEKNYYGDFSGQTMRWHTVTLDEPVPVPDDANVWITIKTNGGGYPAAMSSYSGNDDGSWYKHSDGWASLHGQTDFYGSWMLRALLSERKLWVRVEATIGSVCDLNAVYGTGLYDEGDVATVGIADDGFAYWADADGANLTSDNEYSFVVTADVVLRPMCYSVGIDPVSGDEVCAIVVGRNVSVSTEADLIDAMGRVLGHGRSFEAPVAGVYLLRVGQMVKRILIF